MIYQVCLGKSRNSKLYQFCMESVENYCKNYGIDHIVQTEPILKIKPDIKVTNRSRESYEKHGGFLPIYEKENAFDYLDRYDQIAIIDADIYIKYDTPNIFDELPSEYDFGAVIEREMPINDRYRKKILAYSQGQYRTLKDVEWNWSKSTGAEFFNMGLMIFNRSIKKYLNGETAKEFITRKEFKKFVDGMGNWKWSTDQTLLNYWVKKSGMTDKHLDWHWNSLYKGIKDEYIKDAYFVHFFLKDHLPYKGENIKELQKVLS